MTQNIEVIISTSAPISVPDLDAAVTFYTEVLDCYLIMEATEIVEEEDSKARSDARARLIIMKRYHFKKNK